MCIRDSSRLVDPNGNVYAIVGTDEDLAADGFFLYQNNKKFGQIYNCLLYTSTGKRLKSVMTTELYCIYLRL